MSNGFIAYLNSMNNASVDTVNALAESQVTNKYYNEIRVERKLGQYIIEQIKKDHPKAFIITGHAGDGKTSILVQILKYFNCLTEGEELKIFDEVNVEGKTLLYIKDMSELDDKKQEQFLVDTLKAPSEGKFSILISNTGPLLRAFKSDNVSKMDKDKLEMNLLDQLDLNGQKEMVVDDYKFELINIARVDNVPFAEEILRKILDERFWRDCNCQKKMCCPIYNNYETIKENFNRVVMFVNSYYRWLYENDKRVTIRQMISQITFAITGNLTCGEIQKWQNAKYANFNYNFANLFFGYRGIHLLNEASQIKGIQEIRDLKLDSKALHYDYELFVKNNFGVFPKRIREILQLSWQNFAKRYHTLDIKIDDKSFQKELDMQQEIQMRKAIRRFYLMYSLYEEKEDIDNIFKQVYSSVFPIYNKALFEKLSTSEIKAIKNLVFDALYIMNLGVPAKSRDKIYLTLKREDNAFQNVLLLLGHMGYDDFKVVQENVASKFDDVETKNALFLILKKNDSKYLLKLPLLNYFSNVTDGAITTNIHPALSHGIAELKALISSTYRYDDEEEQIKIIVNTTKSSEIINFEFAENKLTIG